MTSDSRDIAVLSADQLIERIIANALRLGNSEVPAETLKLKRGAPERGAAVKDLHTVARGLRAVDVGRQPGMRL